MAGNLPGALIVHRQRLVRDCFGELEFAGPAIRRPPSHASAEWADKFAAMSIEKPVLKWLRRANKTQWLKPEIGIRAQHLKAKGTPKHATVKAPLGQIRSAVLPDAGPPPRCAAPLAGPELAPVRTAARR